MTTRLARLRQFLHKHDLDAIVISKPENQQYFSGFTGGDSLLIITEQTAQLVTDFRYIEQAATQASLFKIVQHERSLFVKAAEVVRSLMVTKLGFEGDALTYLEFSQLAQQLKMLQLQAVELDPLRIIKDTVELQCIQKAVEISDRAFTHILEILRPGISELLIAAELEHTMRKLGSEKPAFATIVASGLRGSLPHGLATTKELENGDFVTLDFGAVYQGYHSDITRTVCIGRASEQQRKIYDIVLNAQLLGVECVQMGRSGKEIDLVVRRYITDAGYGKFFGHGLGHGVGLAIHELPRLSPSSNCQCLEKNMLVTVEPGIYLPDWGGVRIEDTVLVTTQGAKILTQSSKQLIEIE